MRLEAAFGACLLWALGPLVPTHNRIQLAEGEGEEEVGRGGGVAPLSKSRDPHLAGGKEEKTAHLILKKRKNKWSQDIFLFNFTWRYRRISWDLICAQLLTRTNRSILMTWHASLTTSCCDSSCGKSQVELPWSDYKTRLDHASDSATSDSSVETSGATSETLHFLKNI